MDAVAGVGTGVVTGVVAGASVGASASASASTVVGVCWFGHPGCALTSTSSS